MKLSVLQENLNKGLGVVSHLIQPNNSLEVLGNILLQTNNGLLELQATNLEIAISYKLGAKIEKKGSVSVPARLITELVNSLTNDKLQLISNKDNLEIHALHLNSLLNGINASEFPKIPEVKPNLKFKLDAKDFISAFEYVSSSASLDESRPVLTGVLCKAKNSNLTIAATDSYRLSQYYLQKVKTADFEVIIPTKTINEVLRVIRSENINLLEIGITDTEIVFITKNITITSQLIDGNYPDYSKIIPNSSETIIEIQKAELHSGLKIASLFSRENANTINLKTKERSIEISAEGAQVGVNNSDIPAKITGKQSQISINAKYLIDSLSTIHNTKVVISLNNKLDPCVVSTSSKKSNNFHIIMPLKS